MSTAAEAIEIRLAEPDLIDRIAKALPEEVRAEYYRELLHCRSLPENDEMLRLLRAMQFLVLLIEQAPSRVAAERERLDTILASGVDNLTRLEETSEAYHVALQQKLTALPRDIAIGISPEVVAGKISEILGQEFMRSGLPRSAEALGEISDKMKKVCAEFAATSDNLGSIYRGAAEAAKNAVASLNSEITQAAAAASLFTTQIARRSASGWRWSLFMVASGALVIGLGLGMTFESWLLSESGSVAAPAAAAVHPAPAPPAAKVSSRK